MTVIRRGGPNRLAGRLAASAVCLSLSLGAAAGAATAAPPLASGAAGGDSGPAAMDEGRASAHTQPGTGAAVGGGAATPITYRCQRSAHASEGLGACGFGAQPLLVRYAEGSALRVATFAARDGARWYMWGPDAALFEIGGGVLRFTSDGGRFVPDFERPADADGDNRYEVTVWQPGGARLARPAGGLWQVSVLVDDRDEPGAVRLSDTRPAVGTAVAARLIDPDGGVGAVAWRWERSAGPDTFEPIEGAEGAAYVPAAADTGRRLRAVATYTDRHGAAARAARQAGIGDGRASTAAAATAGEVLGPLLVSLSASADGGDGGGMLVPAFRPDVLHYKVACDSRDVVQVAATLPGGARLDVNGVQPRPGTVTGAAVAVTDTSDIVLRLARDDGAFTRYVIHCAPEELAALRTRVPAEAPPAPLLSVVAGSWIAVMDEHGVPRFHREVVPVPGGRAAGFFLRSFGTGPARRWAHASTGGPDGPRPGDREWRILDAHFEPGAGAATVPPLTTTGQHDFRLLADGSMLAMTYEPAVRDFSWLSDRSGAYSPAPAVRFDDPEGRPWSTATATTDSAIQLIDADGGARWTWSSWGRLPLEDCAQHRFPEDYAHVNSTQMTPDGVVASFRGCSAVMLIDPGAAPGAEIVWRIGQTNLAPGDWGERGLGPPPLDLVGDPLGAFCGQHAAALVGGAPEARLLLFDNGAACVIDPATGEPLSRPGEEYSRAVEYAIDAANGEAVFVRDHSLGGLRSVLGAVGGHIEVLPDGAWLVSWGRLRGAHAGDEAAAAADVAVSIVDPSTGAESFAILRSGLVSGIRELRALPVDRGAFDTAPAPLTAAFTDVDPVLPGPVAGGAPDRLTLPDRAGAVGVAVAFSRPVAAFAADTPSIEVIGGRLVASAPRIEFGKPANSHILAIAPDGPGPVTVHLVGGVPCDEGGICTADGTRLDGAGARWSWSGQ